MTPPERADAKPSTTDVADRASEEPAPHTAEPAAAAAVQAENEIVVEKRAEDHDEATALDRDASEPEPDRSLPLQDVVDHATDKEPAAYDAAPAAAAALQAKNEVATENEADVGDGAETESGAEKGAAA